MISDDEFISLQSKYFENKTPYIESNTHYKEAKLSISALHKADIVNEELKEKYDDERHWYQQQLIKKGITASLSIHLLTQHHFYDSAYRDIRTLLEAFLILNHMNENKIQTSIEFNKQQREIYNSDVEMGSIEWTWKEMCTEDSFHTMLKDEKNRFKKHEGKFGNVFNFFSNRNVHPIRLEGIDLDRTYDQKEESQILDWQLDLTVGLLIQLIKLYSDTPDFKSVKDRLIPYIDNIESNHTVQNFIYISLENFPES